MTVDKNYCMSSYLMFRSVVDHNKTFKEGIIPNFCEVKEERTPVYNSFELEKILKEETEKICANKKVALALSGGIDSAILARFMPKGSVAYTFKCVVPGIEVTDETPAAAAYAKACGLEHRIVEIYWEDFEKYAPVLMKHKGMPMHSIEVQIYKAALKAKEDGFDCLLFGETADLNYGGHSLLLSRDWTVPEFIERISYIMPHQALKDGVFVKEPFQMLGDDSVANIHEFLRQQTYPISIASYINSTQTADIDISMPYSKTFLGVPLDVERIRRGENKYMVREIFQRLYPGFKIPPKTPMPRPMNEWFKDWEGPKRPEFWKNCVKGLDGDQKWLLYALETFLNMIDA